MKPPREYAGKVFTPLIPPKDLVYGYMFGYINKVQYTSKYHKQILSRCDPQQVVDDLLNLSPDPILLCACDLSKKAFCHRRVVADWLSPIIGDIQELNPPRKQPHAGLIAHSLDDFV